MVEDGLLQRSPVVFQVREGEHCSVLGRTSAYITLKHYIALNLKANKYLRNIRIANIPRLGGNIRTKQRWIDTSIDKTKINRLAHRQTE